MNNSLTKDEYAALEQIDGPARERETACVSRNAKRLAGLKYIAYENNNRLVLTEKGHQALFLQQCINALRALETDPKAYLGGDVETFLRKKGHVVAVEGAENGFEITVKGRESLADIDAAAR
ncbi:hypothetical protein RGU70_13870 [Herbaspirillum sp. RTI4]|uniref:hypothetical protein n=1 Tax=Herbaspirillum sp. RTI4 TaxID=3048640 RepID=UPI002AB5CEF1|nr:hypothetical protein [Herbaspirillum sp. RTI4]MDY7579401.1 hypothetical protein [Herbaspirillum sp. RTI4]MEA9980315.1 hypothetical protein [Herbaspirillum sp. RTI4]